MKNNYLVLEKLRDSLKGLDEATKYAEADRAALISRVVELELLVFSLEERLAHLERSLSLYGGAVVVSKYDK